MKETDEETAVAISNFKEQGFNVIASDDHIHTTSAEHRVDFAVIKVDPNPKMGDVYKSGWADGNDLFALTGSTLNKLAIAAAISWDPKESGPNLATLSRDYVFYVAVGYLTIPSGETMTLKGSYELDLEVITDEEMEDQAMKLANKGRNRGQWDRDIGYDDLNENDQKIVDRKVRKAMIQHRKMKMRKAETGAKNRAIRSMGLKGSYTAQQLSQPFVIPRIVPDGRRATSVAEVNYAVDQLTEGSPIAESSPTEVAYLSEPPPLPGGPPKEKTMATDAMVERFKECADRCKALRHLSASRHAKAMEWIGEGQTHGAVGVQLRNLKDILEKVDIAEQIRDQIKYIREKKADGSIVALNIFENPQLDGWELELDNVTRPDTIQEVSLPNMKKRFQEISRLLDPIKEEANTEQTDLTTPPDPLEDEEHWFFTSQSYQDMMESGKLGISGVNLITTHVKETGGNPTFAKQKLLKIWINEDAEVEATMSLAEEDLASFPAELIDDVIAWVDEREVARKGKV